MYLLAAWLESGQQFCLLRGKLGLGQNASSMKLGQPLYRGEYVLMPASSSADRGLLLRGHLMHGFGRCVRSTRAGDGRQAAYVNGAELAREA